MLLNDSNYDEIVEMLTNVRNTAKCTNWKELDKKFTREKIFMATELNLSLSNPVLSNSLSIEVINDILDELIEEEKNSKVSTLEEGNGNDIDTIPTAEKSSWQLYRKSLLDKGWSMNSVQNIEDSSLEILKKLSFETIDTTPVKGLVVGNVQSGKTANMAGLIAMAADYNFNCFIILSGMIEKLRVQTEERMRNDLAGYGQSNLNWKLLEKGTVAKQYSMLQSLDLGEDSKNRILSITLKQKNRLDYLFKALKMDPKQAKQLKILIIDDEADHGSINTNDLEGEKERTAINRLITDFVNKSEFKAINYIAYTATPFANVLNENNPESLYPKNFITLLNSGEDYIGAKEIFGLEKPERRSNIPIVREIKNYESEMIKQMQKDESDGVIPLSLKNAIQWFIVSVAALRSIGYKKPLTMLVHTSFIKKDHNFIADKIKDYLRLIKKNPNLHIEEIRELYEKEKKMFTREDFLINMPNYSSKANVPNYPIWNEVRDEIFKIINLPESTYFGPIINQNGVNEYHKGIHISIDNSDKSNQSEGEMIRLEYPDKEQEVAPAFLVIGGNTLSRGLTLEGLVTSYFLRNTKQADTLLQMARWFGYRKGYEIFPRVWLDAPALKKFEFISQMNEDFRKEIEVYSEYNITPKNYAPKVKNSPDNVLLRVTSSNKSQAAIDTEFNFAGFDSQTIYFDNNINILEQNIQVTKQFLNSLPTPEFPKDSRMLWRNVDGKSVTKFLSEYIVNKYDKKMSLLPELINWIEENSRKSKDHKTLRPWNVILSSKGNIKDTEGTTDDWNIHGYCPIPVVRNKKLSSPDENIANIGVLRSPLDLLIDIDLEKNEKSDNPIDLNSATSLEVIKARKKHGIDDIPRLVIYRIDRGSRGETDTDMENLSKDDKIPLDFPLEPIGIFVVIPSDFSSGQNKNLAGYLSVKPDKDYLERIKKGEDDDVTD